MEHASDPVPAVAALRSLSAGGRTYDIRTHVIGLGSDVDAAQLNAMASGGGTGAPLRDPSQAALDGMMSTFACP